MFILFFILLPTKCLCLSLITNEEPFWINSCGYNSENEIFDDSDNGIISRILFFAKQSQTHIDKFRDDYIMNTFNCNYFTHYQRWLYQTNEWITLHELRKPEDDLSQEWLCSRSFPNELVATFNILQRVSVGFELLLQDASKIDSLEHNFLVHFITCKSDLKQLLCELSDDIEIRSLEMPADIQRDVIPIDVLLETATAKRNLTNSIIFRDYMIAIKYISTTYKYLKNKLTSKNSSFTGFKSHT